MRKPSPRPSARRPPRGVTLVEALVAMAVMAFGMLALAGVQRTIAINADLSRQLTDATRITASEMASLRSYVTLDPIPPAQPQIVTTGAGAGQAWDRSSWSALASVAAQTIAQPDAAGANATFTRTTAVGPEWTLKPAGLTAVTAPRLKVASVTTAWRDRAGQGVDVGAIGIYAAVDTALSNRIVMAMGPTPAVQRNGGHAAIPRQAVDLGNGEFAYKPFDNTTGIVWIFNRDTGVVTRVCMSGVAARQADLTVSNVAGCTTTGTLYFVSGTIRFDLRAPPAIGAALPIDAARRPQGPTLALETIDPFHILPGTEHNFSSLSCLLGPEYAAVPGESPSAVDYACLVTARAAGGWGGRLYLTSVDGRPVPDDGSNTVHRVCRYTTLTSEAGEAPRHPSIYCHADPAHPLDCNKPVTTNLINQNYLVIAAAARCPAVSSTSTDAGATAAELVDASTRQHQPQVVAP